MVGRSMKDKQSEPTRKNVSEVFAIQNIYEKIALQIESTLLTTRWLLFVIKTYAARSFTERAARACNSYVVHKHPLFSSRSRSSSAKHHIRSLIE